MAGYIDVKNIGVWSDIPEEDKKALQIKLGSKTITPQQQFEALFSGRHFYETDSETAKTKFFLIWEGNRFLIMQIRKMSEIFAQLCDLNIWCDRTISDNTGVSLNTSSGVNDGTSEALNTTNNKNTSTSTTNKSNATLNATNSAVSDDNSYIGADQFKLFRNDGTQMPKASTEPELNADNVNSAGSLDMLKKPDLLDLSLPGNSLTQSKSFVGLNDVFTSTDSGTNLGLNIVQNKTTATSKNNSMGVNNGKSTTISSNDANDRITFLNTRIKDLRRQFWAAFEELLW